MTESLSDRVKDRATAAADPCADTTDEQRWEAMLELADIKQAVSRAQGFLDDASVSIPKPLHRAVEAVLRARLGALDSEIRAVASSDRWMPRGRNGVDQLRLRSVHLMVDAERWNLEARRPR